jgi:ribonucleoside-diphosphate reductase alpha chain
MPTASTAQILGNNECFEPYTSNIYTRRVLAGEYIIVNKHLLKDLVALGLWNEDLKNKLIQANGSVQNIPEIPVNLKELYRTAWEIPQKAIIDMSADRGAYICQSQSLNVFMENVNAGKLTSMHFYAWEKGLKTGMYYLRTKAATDAIKFTVDKKYKDQPTEIEATTVVVDPGVGETTAREREREATMKLKAQPELDLQDTRAINEEELARQQAAIACSLDNPDSCEMCSG